jgi:hypothetical protein
VRFRAPNHESDRFDSCCCVVSSKSIFFNVIVATGSMERGHVNVYDVRHYQRAAEVWPKQQELVTQYLNVRTSVLGTVLG